MKLLSNLSTLSIIVLLFLATACTSNKKTETAIDGTYELTERVLADGTTLRPPKIKALYVLFKGRINFNLFVKKKDGTMSSESTIGHYTFTNNQTAKNIAFGVDSRMGKWRGIFGVRRISPLETTDAPIVNSQSNPSFLWSAKCTYAQGSPCP